MGWQLDIDGMTPVDRAIDRIRGYERSDGYFLAFSGGKDSVVLLDLAKRAGVAFDAHYSWTTVDPPELFYFIRDEFPDVAIDRPDVTMWQLIEKKRMPPTHRYRYCCEYLKERSGAGRIVLTGVRAAESPRRARRKSVEIGCFKDRGGADGYVHPIFEWTDEDVWQYIAERGLPYCSLYDEGWTRLGCVMCPMQNSTTVARDIARWPKIAAAYKRAIERAYEGAVADGLDPDGTRPTPEQTWEWWIAGRDQEYANGADPLF